MRNLAVAAREAQPLPEERRRASPAPRRGRGEAALTEPRRDVPPERDHRDAGGGHRRAAAGDQGEEAEPDQAADRPQLLPPRARRQHPGGASGIAQLVGDPRDIGPAREGPAEAPEHLRRDQDREGGGQPGGHHAAAHQQVREHQRPLAADRVGHHPGRHLAHQRDESLGGAEGDQLERREVGIDDEVEAGDEPVAAMQERTQPDPAHEDGGDVRGHGAPSTIRRRARRGVSMHKRGIWRSIRRDGALRHVLSVAL
jgi:hypothetical protein